MKISMFFIFFISFLSFSQYSDKKREINDDWSLININTSAITEQKTQTLKMGSVPFGTQPDWQCNLYRQAGGITWGDYDGDGDLDLAVGNYFSNSWPPVSFYETQIFKNNHGVLTDSPAWQSTDMRSSTDIKFADINGDGRVDLLACNGSSSGDPSVIYMNSESGLSKSPSWTSNPFAWSVSSAFADLDGDGDLDLAFGNQWVSPNPYKPIAVFHNNNGQFPTSPTWVSADQMITNSVAWNDINNSDLVKTEYSLTIGSEGYAFHLPKFPIYSIDSVILNNKKISGYCFDRVNGWISIGRKASIGSSLKVYYTFMKKCDLAATKWVSFSSGIYYNDNGVLGQTAQWTTGNTEVKKGCAWGDMDNDGFLDLVMGGNGTQTVIYKNNNGIMSASPVWVSASANTSSQEVVWGDINNDGWGDLAIAHFSPAKVEVFLNKAGTFNITPDWTFITPNGCNCLALGDLNGDGFLDLALGTAAQPAIVFINKSTPQVCNDINISSGWNLVSAPSINNNMSAATLFPTAVSPAYAFENTYIPKDTLKNGIGYWMKFNNNQNISLCGNPVQQTVISIKSGWNLFGVFDKEIQISAITTNPSGIIASQYFEYQNGYFNVEILKPGRAYWVKSLQDGVINLPSGK